MMIPVAVVGATGIAGQQVLAALDGHPYFQIAALAASERSASKSFEQAITDADSGMRRWYVDGGEPPRAALALEVQDARSLRLDGIRLVFAAVESEAARELEPLYAQHVPTISTARPFRMEPDVPLLIPGVNLDHIAIVSEQQRRRGWKGYIATLPNCTATGLAVTLKALDLRFGIDAAIVTTMQGISGAGRDLPALDIVENIIPYIPREEERVRIETCKILGRVGEGAIAELPLRVSATCTRASVLAGHTEAVTVGLKKAATVEEVISAMEEFGREFTAMNLPTSPKNMITVHRNPMRPQPRLDRDADRGMTTSVGRVRLDEVLPNGIKYLLVSHNAAMGAGRGAVLLAEYLKQTGHVG
ncbi:MAG TPA: aspartate-semialdehyde dehydrogenase [Candidatus Binataceae bacterium]|jgi:aspartate-semialdehyde dehydrogenase|nr:aspartate-semialdehyde dehydrogenase [Candidatus Binataceae bacterium]